MWKNSDLNLSASKTFECYLQGEVPASDYKNFLERLSGLCADGTLKDDFAYKESVYSFDRSCPNYVTGAPLSDVRARQMLQGPSKHSGESAYRSTKEALQWELRHLGKSEAKSPSGSSGPVVYFRNQVSVSVSDNLPQFLLSLGFRTAYRYMVCGTRWQLSDGLVVETMKMREMEIDDVNTKFRLVDLENAEVTAYLIEIKAITTDEKIDETCQRIRRFFLDLESYMILRPNDTSVFQHSTATLAAESRKNHKRKLE